MLFRSLKAMLMCNTTTYWCLIMLTIHYIPGITPQKVKLLWFYNFFPQIECNSGKKCERKNLWKSLFFFTYFLFVTWNEVRMLFTLCLRLYGECFMFYHAMAQSLCLAISVILAFLQVWKLKDVGLEVWIIFFISSK